MGENLRNLSDPKPFAKAAGEYYTAVNDSAPHGPGSGIAAQLFVDRQAGAAGHSFDWQQFHQVRNASAGQVLMTGAPATRQAGTSRRSPRRSSCASSDGPSSGRARSDRRPARRGRDVRARSGG